MTDRLLDALQVVQAEVVKLRDENARLQAQVMEMRKAAQYAEKLLRDNRDPDSATETQK